MSAVATPLVVLSAAELEALIERSVRRAMERPTQPVSDILTRDDVAKVLKCHPRTVSKKVRDEKLPVACMVGNQPRFRRSDLETWMKERGR